MKVISVQQMKDLDRGAIEEGGIPGERLMEEAGKALLRQAKRILSRYGRGEGPVLIFCGKGNNGGDGYVLARLLSGEGIPVSVALFGSPEDFGGDARKNYERLAPLDVEVIEGRGRLEEVRRRARRTALVVDALLGTGVQGAVHGELADAIDAINAAQRPVLSVDVPSGLNADTGEAEGPVVLADWTVTMGLPKAGLVRNEGINRAGRISVADIGIPDRLVREVESDTEMITAAWVREKLGRRRRASHKGDYGKLLVLGGSPGFTGAAALCCGGALRSGAGLVTLGVSEGVHDIVEVKLTEAMSVPLPQTREMTLNLAAATQVLKGTSRFDAIALGPGISLVRETQRFVQQIVSQIRIPIVLDADAITAICGELWVFRKTGAPVVLTPHPGEMARLAGISVPEVQADRWGVARRFAEEYGVTVVLKGACTAVAHPGERLYVNPTGNPGMASGGMGDVLTGMIASYIGQGFSPSDAARLGVFLHGAAGDLAEEEIGEAGIIASDVVERIPRVVSRIRRALF